MQSVSFALPCRELEEIGHVWHVFALAPTTVEYSPTSHSKHGSLPFNILNFPATHWVQVSPLSPVDPESQMQSVSCTLASLELEYLGHLWHVFVLAPTAVEYFPTLHSKHESLPFDILNFPATHWIQLSASGPVDPGSHMHSALPFTEIEFVGHFWHVFEVAPKSVEYSPLIQSEHAALPVVVLYFPATQCMQSSPSGPVDPAEQMQSSFSSLPSGELESDGQIEQSSLPMDVLYFPPEH
jgi:hypothetical protein